MGKGVRQKQSSFLEFSISTFKDMRWVKTYNKTTCCTPVAAKVKETASQIYNQPTETRDSFSLLQTIYLSWIERAAKAILRTEKRPLSLLSLGWLYGVLSLRIGKCNMKVVLDLS